MPRSWCGDDVSRRRLGRRGVVALKRTQFLELLHNIGKTWVSFFSIVMFVALGVGIFLGIMWSGKSVEVAADKAYENQFMYDFQVTFPYGFTDDAVAQIKDIDGVSDVELGYTSYASFAENGQGYVARLQSATTTLNQPTVIEGNLPVSADELALDSVFAAKCGIGVGDTIIFEHDGAADADGMKQLTGNTYTVAALVTLPSDISTTSATRGMSAVGGGSVDCFMVLPEAAFDASGFKGYPTAYISCKGLGGDSFSGDYTTSLNMIKDQLSALGDVSSNARYQALHDEAQAKIDEGQARADAAAAQIASGEQTLADKEAQAVSGKAQLDSGYAQLIDYQAQADAVDAEIAEKVDDTATRMKSKGVPGTKAQIKERIWAILNEAGSTDDDALTLAKKHGIPEKFAKQYEGRLNDAISKYRTYLSLKQQLADGWSTYYTNLDAYNTGLQQLEEGKAQLEQAKADYAAGQVQLQSGKDQLTQMVYYGWTVTGRDTNASSAVVTSYNDVSNRLRYTMASLFLIVGLFVCYVAVSRIVREQVVNIGTKKALGLRSREITVSYLMYSTIAVIIGIVIGALGAVFLVEGILNKAAAGQFTLGAIPMYFSLIDTLLIGGFELVLIVLATWLACRSMLKRHAVELLKGEEPPKSTEHFYEKWKAWDRMSLYSQSIVNNFFNDKLRVIGTVVGVAGCTALIVTAMTLYLNVQETFDTQYSKVYSFTAHASVDGTTDAAAKAVAALDGLGADGAAIQQTTMGIRQPGQNPAVAKVEVPMDAGSFAQLYHLNIASKGSAEGLDDSGCWISSAYSVHNNVKVGDSIQLVNAQGANYDVKVAGVFDYFLNHNEVVMTKNLYAQVFGSDAAANTVLIDLNGVNEDAITGSLSQIDGYFSYTDDYAASKGLFDTMQSLTRTVVFIYLGLSALMALVVLLNLMVMFIDEKKRDLIVLMINGFSIKDAKRYIYLDSIALTVIGIILGILLGMLMGYISILSIEFATDSYVLTPSWVACLVGAGASAFFELVVNLIALRRIPAFNLTDINKM